MKKNNRIKAMMACAAVMCAVAVSAGCSDKEVNYDASVIEGDTVQEYKDGVLTTEGASDDVNSANDTVGGIGGTLGVPVSVSKELSTDGTNLKTIKIEDDSIQTPSSDKMYTKKFTMGEFSLGQREKIVKTIFDEESGIYNYPYDLKNEVTQEMRDEIFASGTGADYSQDCFIGKIGDVEYILQFTNPDWISDVGYYVTLAGSADIPDEMRDKGAVDAYYVDYVTDAEGNEAEAYSVTSVDDIDLLNDPEEPNASSMSPDEALNKILTYLADWGYGEMALSSMSSQYKNYRNSEYSVIGTEKYGYSASFVPSISGDALYQPEAFGIDTLTHNSTRDEDDFSVEGYYYAEETMYSLSINDDGVSGFSCMWPMESVGDIQDAGELITWDEAVESLQSIIPQHFKDYEGYSDVTFNDVRLTYFRTKTGEGEYEVIPVYVFAECEDLAKYGGESLVYDGPIQLIMIDARSGKKVTVVQDTGRFNLKG